MLNILYLYPFHHFPCLPLVMDVLKSLAALDVPQMRALYPPDSLWLPLFFTATLSTFTYPTYRYFEVRRGVLGIYSFNH